MTYDPVAGVFINFSVEAPGGNVVLEVRGGSRQLRKQKGCVYELNYPKDFHSCDPDDPCVHVCGLNAQFHCTVQDCRTFTRQRIDSVNGHRLLELLPTRFLVCCDTASAISPAFFPNQKSIRPTSLLGLSISVQKDAKSWNIGCTPDAGCWLHVQKSASNVLPY